MIAFDRVAKTYPGGARALRGLSLEVRRGEVLVLLGTSGSGKTTALKTVNRLEEPTGGQVLVDGLDAGRQDPVELRRRIGYAVQQVGLFSHLTVAQNIAVVPELLDWSRDRVAARIEELLQLVGLPAAELVGRYPHQLSGGQAQRVGVARALAGDPEIVLLDEPFGALDPITRGALQDAFLALQRRLRKTVLFVTHDVFEAVKVGDRIALLDAGELQQLATPRQLVQRPASEFVARFLGEQRLELLLHVTRIEHLARERNLAPPGDPPPPDAPVRVLRTTDPLIRAIERFRQAGAGTLPVLDGDVYLGNLARDDLVAEAARLLDPGGHA